MHLDLSVLPRLQEDVSLFLAARRGSGGQARDQKGSAFVSG